MGWKVKEMPHDYNIVAARGYGQCLDYLGYITLLLLCKNKIFSKDDADVL